MEESLLLSADGASPPPAGVAGAAVDEVVEVVGAAAAADYPVVDGAAGAGYQEEVTKPFGGRSSPFLQKNESAASMGSRSPSARGSPRPSPKALEQDDGIPGVDDIDGVDDIAVAKKISGPRVAFSMFKYMVGTGILGFPLALHDTGVVGFLVISVAFFVMAFWANYLLAAALDIVGRSDLNIAELGDRGCGRPGFAFATFLCFCEAWGGTMAYLKATASILRPVLEDEAVLGKGSDFTTEWAVIGIIAVIVYPFCLCRKMEELGWVLVVGSACIGSFVVAVIANAMANSRGLAGAPVWKSDGDAALAVPVIAWAWDCQVNVFACYRELDAQTGVKARQLGKWVCLAMGSGLVMMTCVALCGYATYRDDVAAVDGNVLSNFSASWWPLKIVVFVSVLPDIPLTAFEATRILQDFVFGASPVSNALITLFTVGTAALVAIVVPTVYAAFGFVGATTSQSMIFLAPPLFFLGVTRRAYDASPARCGGACGDPADYAAALRAEREAGAAPPPPHPPRWQLYAAGATAVVGFFVVPYITYLNAIA